MGHPSLFEQPDLFNHFSHFLEIPETADQDQNIENPENYLGIYLVIYGFKEICKNRKRQILTH